MIQRNIERAPLGTDERLAQDLLKSGLPLRVDRLEARVRGCERAILYLALICMVATISWGVGEYMEDPEPEAVPAVSIPAVLPRALNEKAGRLR
jgi:hypothetical protein